MSIQAVCPKCGRVCTVGDEAAGRKVRCGECKHVFPSSGGATTKGAAPAPLVDPQARLIKIVVAAAFVGFVGILTAFFWSQHARRVARQEAVASLNGELDRSVEAAQTSMAAFEYAHAMELLTELESRVAEMGDSALTDRLAAEMAAARTAGEDHEAKLAQGYAMFEDRFISPEEKNEILAERQRKREAEIAEEERQAEERERRREAHERRRKANELKRQEQPPGAQPAVLTSIRWEQYHADCGKEPYETNTVRSTRAFDEKYKGKKVKWSGQIVAITEDRASGFRITVKMDPTDGGASDISLILPEELERKVLDLNKGDNVRFVGRIIRQGLGKTDHVLDVEDVYAYSDQPFIP